MTEENLKWLENVFRRTVGENGEIRLQDFKNIVHSKNVSLKDLYKNGNFAWNMTKVGHFTLITFSRTHFKRIYCAKKPVILVQIT